MAVAADERQEEDEAAEESMTELLKDWRAAERDVDDQVPGSGAERQARKRATDARDRFHDVEDDERESRGDYRPRKHEAASLDEDL